MFYNLHEKISLRFLAKETQKDATAAHMRRQWRPSFFIRVFQRISERSLIKVPSAIVGSFAAVMNIPSM